MKVKIYQPSKNAMQSGRGKTKTWLLEYELETPRTPEPLMGWVSSGDTLNQVRLKFDCVDKAVAYAKKEGWEYTVIPHQERVVQPRNYLDNFKYRPHEEAS
ncbi:MAG: oxidoreductase [Alphaproteobacteria bacterium]|nr:oxidoreductase [Alphaproteobacteria bacterium]